MAGSAEDFAGEIAAGIADGTEVTSEPDGKVALGGGTETEVEPDTDEADSVRG